MLADVLVVGGGPAGLATAIAAALKGLRVFVVDPRRPPIDKTCGEGLLPQAVTALGRLGIHLNSDTAFPFKGFSFADEHSSVRASFPEGAGFGLRRTKLHQLLVDRATGLGVTFLWGKQISQLAKGVVDIGGTRIAYNWLIGADGQKSGVAEWAGINSTGGRHTRFGFRRHFLIDPWSENVEVYWGDHCQMVIAPTDAKGICVGFFSSDPQLRIEQALHQFPEIERRLKGGEPITAERGSITTLGKRRAVVREHVALVGDASCTVDGIAGKGLSLALQQAVSLGDALAQEDLSLYESAHRQISQMPIQMTRLLLLMNKSALLRRKALRLFSRKPALFSSLISVHTGDTAAEAFQTLELFDLTMQVLRA